MTGPQKIDGGFGQGVICGILATALFAILGGLLGCLESHTKGFNMGVRLMEKEAVNRGYGVMLPHIDGTSTFGWADEELPKMPTAKGVKEPEGERET